LQTLLGHSHLDTTQIYTRVEVSDLAKVIEKYHPREQAEHDL
jgi:site-specific recombinase XerD